MEAAWAGTHCKLVMKMKAETLWKLAVRMMAATPWKSVVKAQTLGKPAGGWTQPASRRGSCWRLDLACKPMGSCWQLSAVGLQANGESLVAGLGL